MKFEDVGRIWRDQDTGEFFRTRVEDLSSARDRAAKLDGWAWRLGLMWTVLAIVTVPVGVFAGIREIRNGQPVAALGVVIVLVSISSLAIRIRMIRGAKADPTLPVSEAIEEQVAGLLGMERFHNTVEWYLGPFVVGYLVVAASAGDQYPWSLDGRVRMSILAIVAFGLVVFGQRRRARLDVRPLIEDLESWLADLEDSDLGGVPDTY